QRALIERVRGDFALRNNTSTWHGLSPRLGFLRALGAVFRTSLHPALDRDRVERAADDVVADARQILDAAAANEHQRVLLQVVADARDVGRDLDAVGQPDARHLAQRRIRLLRRLREDAHADAALLRAVLQRGALGLAHDLLPTRTNKLTDRRHNAPKTHFGTATASAARLCRFRPK